MNWDRNRRFDDRRGGESYRPTDRFGRPSSRGYARRTRSPPLTRSPRLVADTWVPSTSRAPTRIRSRSPQVLRRRSRSPFRGRDTCTGYYGRTRSPSRRFSPRRDERPRSPPQTFWRSRSPYIEGSSCQLSRGRTPVKRLRELSPSQASKSPKRESLSSSTDSKQTRVVSPSRNGLIREAGSGLPSLPHSRSPYQGGRRESRFEGPPRRSPERCVSSIRVSAPGSVTPRRSPPFLHSECVNVAPLNPRTRSPANQSATQRHYSRPSAPALSYHKRTSSDYRTYNQGEAKHKSLMEKCLTVTVSGDGRDLHTDGVLRSESQQPDFVQLKVAQSSSNNTSTQARSHSASPSQLPQSRPSHGLQSLPSQNRGSISLLSAPTRPRGGPSFRDNTWTGISPARRGAMPTAPLGPALGIRGNIAPTVSGSEIHRPRRQNSTATVAHNRVQRSTNHLTGLSSIVPGGQALSLTIDPAHEKRLSQLETDKERLLEQLTERQKFKRLWIKDWDRLDKEGSISALKSELAEGHLRRMAEGESTQGDTTF